MKGTADALLAATLLAGFGVASAPAIDLTLQPTASSEPSAAIELRLKGDQSNADLANLLILIEGADYSDQSLSMWTDSTPTSLVKVKERFDAAGQAKIAAMVQQNPEEQADLQVAIAANANFTAWLKSNGIDAASIIAVEVNADGSVEVYEG